MITHLEMALEGARSSAKNTGSGQEIEESPRHNDTTITREVYGPANRHLTYKPPSTSPVQSASRRPPAVLEGFQFGQTLSRPVESAWELSLDSKIFPKMNLLSP